MIENSGSVGGGLFETLGTVINRNTVFSSLERMMKGSNGRDS